MRKRLAGLVGILTAAVLLFGMGTTSSAGQETRAADMGPTSIGS